MDGSPFLFVAGVIGPVLAFELTRRKVLEHLVYAFVEIPDILVGLIG
jgi:hypothetical protein